MRVRVRLRWSITLISFAFMIGASIWVVASNWPAGGMPALPLLTHAAAAAAFSMEIVTRSLKIQAAASAVNLRLSFVSAARVCLGGDFAASITPARSGAEPARFLILADGGMPSSGRVLVLFLELFLEMCSLAIVCLVLACVFRGRGASIGGLIGLVGGYSVAVLGATALGFVLSRRNANGPPPGWARKIGLHSGRWRAIQRTLRQLRSSVHSLRTANPWLMALAFGGSILHVLLKVATLPLLVYLSDRAFPLTMNTLAPLVLWPLALFYGGVVVPAPGGGGFIEGAFAATLGGAIPAGIFAASLIWWRFYTFYLYILVGGVAAGDAALRAIRRQDSLAITDSGSVTTSSTDDDVAEVVFTKF